MIKILSNIREHHVRKRISRSLTGKCGTSGESSVHFDNAVSLGFRIERELNVTLSDNTEMSHDFLGDLTKHEVLSVGQGLRRSHNDGITRVNSERIEILHVTHGNAVVVDVSDDFVPVFERLVFEFSSSLNVSFER